MVRYKVFSHSRYAVRTIVIGVKFILCMQGVCTLQITPPEYQRNLTLVRLTIEDTWYLNTLGTYECLKLHSGYTSAFFLGTIVWKLFLNISWVKFQVMETREGGPKLEQFSTEVRPNEQCPTIVRTPFVRPPPVCFIRVWTHLKIDIGQTRIQIVLKSCARY